MSALGVMAQDLLALIEHLDDPELQGAAAELRDVAKESDALDVRFQEAVEKVKRLIDGKITGSHMIRGCGETPCVCRPVEDRFDAQESWRDEPEADREPTDDDLYNGPGMEGGISYGMQDDSPGSLGENDWRL